MNLLGTVFTISAMTTSGASLRVKHASTGGTVADQRPTFRPPHFLDRFLDVTSALLTGVHQSRRDGVLIYDSDSRGRFATGAAEGPWLAEPPPEGSSYP